MELASDNARQLAIGSPKCSHCVNMQAALKETAKQLPNVEFVNFNATAKPRATMALNAALTPPNVQTRAIEGTPTLYVVPSEASRKPAVQYTGARTAADMVAFINKHT